MDEGFRAAVAECGQGDEPWWSCSAVPTSPSDNLKAPLTLVAPSVARRAGGVSTKTPATTPGLPRSPAAPAPEAVTTPAAARQARGAAAPDLERENAQLRAELRRSEQDKQRLQKRVVELEARQERSQQLQGENADLKLKLASLTTSLGAGAGVISLAEAGKAPRCGEDAHPRRSYSSGLFDAGAAHQAWGTCAGTALPEETVEVCTTDAGSRRSSFGQSGGAPKVQVRLKGRMTRQEAVAAGQGVSKSPEGGRRGLALEPEPLPSPGRDTSFQASLPAANQTPTPSGRRGPLAPRQVHQHVLKESSNASPPTCSLLGPWKSSDVMEVVSSEAGNTKSVGQVLGSGPPPGKPRSQSLPNTARGGGLEVDEDENGARSIGMLEAFGAVYNHLVLGTKCTGPDALASNERISEIDLSNEFPPERREAQIDRSTPQPTRNAGPSAMSVQL